MTAHVGRYDLSELSPRRLLAAVRIRVDELPHSVAWRASSLAQENRARLLRYADAHKGERCFIIANGPSLRLMNLSLLKGEVTFGLNRIYLLFGETDFRPTYFVAMNELILEQFSSEIRELSMPKFLNWNRRGPYLRGDDATHFLKSRMVLRDSFQADITKPLVVGGTVTFVALQIAYFMGFSDVVIIGLDHRYIEKGVPSATERRTEVLDRSHFDPDYFPRGSLWQLPDLMRSELDFQLAEAAFAAAGRRVRDATLGGNCPVFQKADFASVLREGRVAAPVR